MSTSKNDLRIIKLEFGKKILVHLSSGDILSIPYDYTPRLSHADPEDLKDYHLIGDGIGVHFPSLDEDISLKGIIKYKREHELMAS